MTLRIGMLLGLIMSLVLGVAGTLYFDIKEGTRQVDAVFQSSQVVDQMQGIQPAMVRLLAYTQLVAKGDDSYDAALRQQLEHLRTVLGKLDARAKQLGARQWSLTQESLNHWQATEEAALELLGLPLDSLQQRGPALSKLVEESSAAIQQSLGILDGEVRAAFQTRVQQVDIWRNELVVKATLWIGALMASCGVLLLLVAATIDRPINDLRKLVRAAARRDFNVPIKARKSSGLKEVYDAFNDLTRQAREAGGKSNPAVSEPPPDEAGFFQDLERASDSSGKRS